MLTHTMIRNDVLMLINKMRTTEVQIPSLWQCIWPGLLLMCLLPTWALLCAGKIKFIYMNIGMSVILFFVIAQIRGKLLSIPKELQNSSVTVTFIKKKLIIYFSMFITINLLSGLLCIANQISPFYMDAIVIPSILIPFFAFIVDMGRFDITLLHAAFSAWQAGESIDNHITQVATPNSPSQLQPTEDK